MKEKISFHEVKGITSQSMKQAEAETLRRYGDILMEKRPERSGRKKASAKQRAAQFLPFAALTGFEDEIREAGVYSEEKKELSDSQKETISETLNLIGSMIKEMPTVHMEVYEKSKDHSGGKYREISGRVRKMDRMKKEMILLDDTRIAFDDLLSLELLSDRSSDTE